jgi:hypothetical protein
MPIELTKEETADVIPSRRRYFRSCKESVLTIDTLRMEISPNIEQSRLQPGVFQLFLHADPVELLGELGGANIEIG